MKVTHEWTEREIGIGIAGRRNRSAAYRYDVILLIGPIAITFSFGRARFARRVP